MNIGGYGVAGIASGYGTQNVSQISNKPFTVPIWGEDVNKTNNAPKTDTNKSRDFTSIEYDPFKDIAKTGNFEVPDYIHTKTEPTRSDEEILKEIEELAKEHARTGQSTNGDKKFQKLLDEYISSVSPDREGVLKKSVPEINGIASGICGAISQDYNMNSAFQQIDTQRTHKVEEEEKEKELIDYLLEGLKNGEAIEEGNATIKSDMYEGVIKDGVVQHVFFFDPNSESKGNEFRLDESIMMYREGGRLTQQLTQEELSRKKEVNASYNAAYDFACGRKDLKAIDPSEIYKEAYNSTYERLTNVVA